MGHLRLRAAEFEALLLSDQGLIIGRQGTRYTTPLSLRQILCQGHRSVDWGDSQVDPPPPPSPLR